MVYLGNAGIIKLIHPKKVAEKWPKVMGGDRVCQKVTKVMGGGAGYGTSDGQYCQSLFHTIKGEWSRPNRVDHK